MDPLSQAVLGATLSGVCCRKKEWVRPALVAGVVGGMLPDLDIVIRSSQDSLLFLQFHRHFTHAFAFVPLGGLLAALLCWPVLKRWLPFAWIYLFATLGYATHGVLDAMTNYGTHLWWPFTSRRESWSIISIIDPVFTLPLVALCAIAFVKHSRRHVAIAAAFALCYWSFGLYQRESATAVMQEIAASRGHVVERSEVKPSFANIIVWRTQYAYDGRYYVDAVRVLPGVKPVRYEGGSVEAFDPSAMAIAADSTAARDLARFAFFSDGWLSVVPTDAALMIGDMRFSALPQEIEPLWGIQLDPAQPHAHVRFHNFHRARMERLPLLWDMVMGRDVPQDLLASQ